MTQVFISHSSMDKDFVEDELLPLLHAHSIGTWYFKDDIPSASIWEKTIREGLVGSDWFLVVLTPRAIDSEWVQAEVHWAMENRRDRFVSLLVEDCVPSNLHLQLIRYQHIDYRNDIDRARSRLLSVWGRSLRDQLSVDLFFTLSNRQDQLNPKIKIRISEIATIGRSPDSTIRLQDEMVSRQHAVFKVRKYGKKVSLWITDLGTTNGTFVNGIQIKTSKEVYSGDVISIADQRITIAEIRPH